MLSVLIPSYNYDCTELVQAVSKQSKDCGITYEIICRDDFLGNSHNTEKNLSINSLPFCSYQVNSEQLGRARNRNNLSSLAKHEWILFLDCDMLPVNDSFIQKYLEVIRRGKNCAFYGGVAYKEELLSAQNALRYYYGINREAIDLSRREQRPYRFSLTSNFLINKRQFQFIKYNESIAGYGYEDLVLIHNLRKKNISIKQLDNPSYHMQLETSTVFLEKCKQAMENLKHIEDYRLVSKNHTRIQWAYQGLSLFFMCRVFITITGLFEKRIKQNLMSASPSMKFLDIFKLRYFCQLKSN